MQRKATSQNKTEAAFQPAITEEWDQIQTAGLQTIFCL